MTQTNDHIMKSLRSAAQVKSPDSLLNGLAITLTQHVLDAKLPNQAEALLNISEHIAASATAKKRDTTEIDALAVTAFNAAAAASSANETLREPARIILQKTYALMSENAQRHAKLNANVAAEYATRNQPSEAVAAIGFTAQEKGKTAKPAHHPDDLSSAQLQKIADTLTRIKARESGTGRA